MARFEPAEFEQAVPGSYRKEACSPQFQLGALDDVGLRVNGPSRVVVTVEDGGLAPGTTIPLCIGAKLPRAVFARYDDFFAEMAVVAVDKRTGASFTSDLASPELTDPIPRAPVAEAELRDSLVTKYHTVDLEEYLALPGVPATYVVYVAVEDYRSNTVEIELVTGP